MYVSYRPLSLSLTLSFSFYQSDFFHMDLIAFALKSILRCLAMAGDTVIFQAKKLFSIDHIKCSSTFRPFRYNAVLTHSFPLTENFVPVISSSVVKKKKLRRIESIQSSVPTIADPSGANAFRQIHYVGRSSPFRSPLSRV